MIKKLQNMSYRVAALATTGFMLGLSDAYADTTGFQGASENIQKSAQNIPELISTVAYIGGAGMGVAGVLKLKQHVDNPGQNPLKDGLVRLGAGGGLLALPFVLDSMTSTIGTSGSVSYNSLPTFGN